MWALSSSKIVRFLVAPLLSLWVAGAGCLLGCEGMVAAAAAAANGQNSNVAQHSEHGPAIVASGHACSSGGPSAGSSDNSNGSHNCCKTSTEVKPKVEQSNT